MILPSLRTYAGWLALVRALTGVLWLAHAVPKFLKGPAFLPPEGRFATYLQQGIATTAGPYHDFMMSVVQPNAALFAELVRLGELMVGVSLLFGLFSRIGAFFGVVLPLNYMAARGFVGTLGSPDASIALLSLINLVLPTGRVAGFDGLRASRAARRPTVIAEVVPEHPLDGR